MGYRRSGKVKVKPDAFQAAVQSALDEFDTYITSEVMKTAIHNTAVEVAGIVRDAAPVKTGDYKDSITSGSPQNKRRSHTETVYIEAPEYRLGHLLERGHAKRNGGRVEGHEHWQKGADSVESILERKITEAIQ